MNMTRVLFSLAALALGSAGPGLAQQSFVGTNAPGQGSNFVFSIGPETTNFSLLISNNATAYSYLFLKRGGVPADTDFDYTARLVGQTNAINLEAP